jgi:hypothetical protein
VRTLALSHNNTSPESQALLKNTIAWDALMNHNGFHMCYRVLVGMPDAKVKFIVGSIKVSLNTPLHENHAIHSAALRHLETIHSAVMTQWYCRRLAWHGTDGSRWPKLTTHMHRCGYLVAHMYVSLYSHRPQSFASLHDRQEPMFASFMSCRRDIIDVAMHVVFDLTHGKQHITSSTVHMHELSS